MNRLDSIKTVDPARNATHAPPSAPGEAPALEFAVTHVLDGLRDQVQRGIEHVESVEQAKRARYNAD